MFEFRKAQSLNLTQNRAPRDQSGRVALRVVKFMRVCAKVFFDKGYGHSAVVLETVATVPGTLGRLLQHLKAIRRIPDD